MKYLKTIRDEILCDNVLCSKKSKICLCYGCQVKMIQKAEKEIAKEILNEVDKIINSGTKEQCLKLKFEQWIIDVNKIEDLRKKYGVDE